MKLSNFGAIQALLAIGLLTSSHSLAQTQSQSDLFASDSQVLKSNAALGEVLYAGTAGAPDVKLNKFTALLVPRSVLPNVQPELLNKLAEQIAANSLNPGLRFVTVADLNASSTEARAGGPTSGSLLDFSNEQSALNEAVNRGIALIVFVDLTHFNLKGASVAGANGLNILSSRVGLTLFNAAEGTRVKTIDRELKTRGFDSQDLTDKAFDSLAKDLATVASRWDVKDLKIKFHEVEVHAKFDGVRFPVLDFSDPTGAVRITESPLFVEGAMVEIDGVLRGQAPCRANLAPGTHAIRVWREGVRPFEAKIQVQGTMRYDVRLVPDELTENQIKSQLQLFERLKSMAMERGAKADRAAATTKAITSDAEIRTLTATAQAEAVRSKSEAVLIEAKARAEEKIAAAEGGRDMARARADAVRARSEAFLNESKANSEQKLATAEATRLAANANVETARSQAQATEIEVKSKADAIKLDSEGKLVESKARAEQKSATAQAIRSRPEGAVATAVAREIVREEKAVSNPTGELRRLNSEALESFRENLSKLSFKLRPEF
jgi:hypothetical protein